MTAWEQVALGAESRPGRRLRLPVPQLLSFTARQVLRLRQACRTSTRGALARGQPVPVFLAHQPLAVLLGRDFLNTLLTRDVLQPQALVSVEILWSTMC